MLTKTEPTKTCITCAKSHVLSYFRKGGGNQCKGCLNKANQLLRQKIKEAKPITHPNNEKTCKDCKKAKHISKFPPNCHYKDHLAPRCKKCDRKHQLKRSLKIQYGLTLKEYMTLYQNQNKGCAICGIPKCPRLTHRLRPLDVDHVPNSNPPIVRGLLCNKCNVALCGLETLMDSNLLQKALDLLSSHNCKPKQNSV